VPDDRGKPENPSGPGWYPDPWSADGKGERYFDGKRWGTTERPRARHTTVAVDERRPRTPGWSRSRVVVSIAVLAALVVGFVVVQRATNGTDDVPTTSPSANPSPAAALRPPPGAESSAQPIGRPATPPPGTGGYEVLAHQPRDEKTPIAFDPCRPIHYVVNPDGAPADGAQLVESAIASLSGATGLKFVNDGTTTEAPAKERRAYLPNRYSPNRWAPVLVAWSDEQSFPNLAGYLAGIAGPSTVYASSNTAVYVSGIMVLDRAQLSAEADPDRAAVRAVILHELGHLVGLDHTADRNQLMFSESQFNVRDYADGDRRGLAVMGTQACVPEV
jgi:hypothetical protein